MARRLAIVLVCACVLALAACAPAATSHPAAKAVDEALRLRRDLVKDADRYAAYFDASVAKQLASDTAGLKESPIPVWEKPYVSSQTSTSAEVVVVWRGERPGGGEWPHATLFDVGRTGDRWRIDDATPLTATDTPKPAGDIR